MRNIPVNKPLFVFGTLLDPDIKEEVFGSEIKNITAQKAFAKGFTAKEYPGHSYPILLKHDGSTTQGLMLCGLSELATKRLAFYEGDLYQLQTITVEIETKHTVEAIYHATGNIEANSFKKWTLSDWQENHKDDYLKKCRAFMTYFGKITAEEANELWEKL